MHIFHTHMKFQYLTAFAMSLSNLAWVIVERPFPLAANSSVREVILKCLLAKSSVIQRFWFICRASSSLFFFFNVLEYINVSSKHLMTGSLTSSHSLWTLLFILHLHYHSFPDTSTILRFLKIVHNLEDKNASQLFVQTLKLELTPS